MFVVLGRKLIKLSVFVSNVDQILLTGYKNLAAKNAPTTLLVRMTDRPDNENSSTYVSFEITAGLKIRLSCGVEFMVFFWRLLLRGLLPKHKNSLVCRHVC